MSQVFSVKARLSATQVDIFVSPSTTIRQIKDDIEIHLQVPVPEQKLICQGKVLKDSDTVETAKLEPGFVLQVAQTKVEPRDVASQVSETDLRPEPFLGLQSLLNSLPTAVLFSRNARRRQRRSFSQTLKLEAVRQNLMTLESLVEIRNRPLYWRAEDQLFLWKRRKLAVGLWVDVCDTVDAWLEAQVVAAQQRNETDYVLIHYNEWPSQWDEWISVSSARIQPFRSFTKQSLDSPVQSPFPLVISPEVFSGHDTLLDVAEYIQQASTLLYSLTPLLAVYCDTQAVGAEAPPNTSEDLYEDDFEPLSDSDEAPNLSPSALSHLKQAQQLSVLADRLGRALSDLGVLSERPVDGELRPMPTLSEGRLVEQEAEIRIHAIFTPMGRRRQ